MERDSSRGIDAGSRKITSSLPMGDRDVARSSTKDPRLSPWIYLGTYEVEPSPRSPSIYTRARARRRRRQGSARHVEPCKARKSTGVSATEIWGDIRRRARARREVRKRAGKQGRRKKRDRRRERSV